MRGVDPESGQVLIDHGEIVGLMGAMTMSFDASDSPVFAQLAPGKIIDFVATSDGRAFTATDIVIKGSTFDDRAANGFDALVRVDDPAPGFALTDQQGRPVTLASLRGYLVMLDFIYTRCPGPCPVLTATRVSLQRKLTPALVDRVRFVSISLDPEHDTAEALLSYASRHRADLSTWSFLGGEPQVVQDVVAAYGIGNVRRDDGEIDHIVATFLLDAEGIVVERYLGLEHSPASLLEDIERFAAAPLR